MRKLYFLTCFLIYFVYILVFIFYILNLFSHIILYFFYIFIYFLYFYIVDSFNFLLKDEYLIDGQGYFPLFFYSYLKYFYLIFRFEIWKILFKDFGYSLYSLSNNKDWLYITDSSNNLSNNEDWLDITDSSNNLSNNEDWLDVTDSSNNFFYNFGSYSYNLTLDSYVYTDYEFKAFLQTQDFLIYNLHHFLFQLFFINIFILIFMYIVYMLTTRCLDKTYFNLIEIDRFWWSFIDIFLFYSDDFTRSEKLILPFRLFFYIIFCQRGVFKNFKNSTISQFQFDHGTLNLKFSRIIKISYQRRWKDYYKERIVFVITITRKLENGKTIDLVRGARLEKLGFRWKNPELKRAIYNNTFYSNTFVDVTDYTPYKLKLKNFLYLLWIWMHFL